MNYSHVSGRSSSARGGAKKLTQDDRVEIHFSHAVASRLRVCWLRKRDVLGRFGAGRANAAAGPF